MLGFDEHDLVESFRSAGFSELNLEVRPSEWKVTSGDEWRRRLLQQPNPLSLAPIELIESALGSEAPRYLAFMSIGVDQGGVRHSVPSAYLAGVAS